MSDQKNRQFEEWLMWLPIIGLLFTLIFVIKTHQDFNRTIGIGLFNGGYHGFILALISIYYNGTI